ncbi:MAG: substrate-binding periplasmic protein [Desulfovibrio sp.]
MRLIERGQALGSIGWYMTGRRAKFAIFSDVISPSEEVFFYMKDRITPPPQLKNIYDLKRYTVGTQLSFWFKDILDEYGIAGEYSEGYGSLYRKLYHGRFELLPDNKRVGWKVIKMLYPNDMEKFSTVPNPYVVGDLRVMFSKKHAQSYYYLKKLNDGLGIIKANGIYNKILNTP